MSSTVGATSKSGLQRTIRYTPATTIVAAWMSALTGVGPSIASGSQVWSGIWADFATAPPSSPRTITLITHSFSASVSAWAKTPA